MHDANMQGTSARAAIQYSNHPRLVSAPHHQVRMLHRSRDAVIA
jgi:hypothetical protein